MTEEDWLAACAARPADDLPRLAYADWLEERGDHRAAFVRAAIELAKLAPDDNRSLELRDRLRELGADLPTRWMAIVCRTPIENCGLWFRFRCPKKWEQLQSTSDQTVRFCGRCRKQVYFCSTIEGARKHATAGDCVALDPRLLREPGDLEEEEELMLGGVEFDEEE